MKTSDQIDALAAALARAQSRVSAAEKSAQNAHLRNRYSTLDDVWTSLRPPLAAEGLAVVQTAYVEGRQCTTTTRILHTSGQWLEVVGGLEVPSGKGTNSAQQAGIAITYSRRYELLALFGVAGSDTDGVVGEPPGYDEDAPHDANWERDKGRFFAALPVDYEAAKKWCEKKGWPKPSAGGTDNRRRIVEALRKEAT